MVVTGIEPVKHYAVDLKSTPVSNWVNYLPLRGIEPRLLAYETNVLTVTP